MLNQIKRWFLGAIVVSAFLGMAGCGSDGKDGKDADPAVLEDLQSQIDNLSGGLDDVRPEACVLCHDDSGSLAKSGVQHQVEYDEYYQDQGLRVINVQYSNSGGNDTVTFDMFKKDEFGVYQPFDCTLATTNPEPDVTDALSINWVQYNPTTYDSTRGTFTNGGTNPFSGQLKLAGAITYLGDGHCQSVKTQSTLGNLNALNGHLVVYGRDETLDENPDKHLTSPKYPFAAMIKTGTGTTYDSLANSSGCENCHTRPFLKHAYVYGEVSTNVTDLAVEGNELNDFYVCKTCHLDVRNGFHPDWQILKDDPVRHAEILKAVEDCPDGDTTCNSFTKNMTADEIAKYTYQTRLMNDVHMSHEMEFGFPQTMRNCVICHGDYKGGNPDKVDEPEKDKLAETLAAENFLAETCISCHAVDGLVAKMTTNRAGVAIDYHDSFIYDGEGKVDVAFLKTRKCYACHSPSNYVHPDGTDYSNTAGAGPEFVELHSGYDPEIYTDDGIKYSEAISVSIDSAIWNSADNTLTVKFSASEDIAIDPYQPEDIEPTLMIGPYGYDSKHYIVYPHDRDADGNRLLEWEVGSGDHPRFEESETSVPGNWEVIVRLGMWADMIADGSIRRLEVGVMPALDHESITELDRRGNLVPMLVAMNAPSRTFDLVTGGFLNQYPEPVDGIDVVDVLGGCNDCHDALATSFHSAQRGGNIKICKMCHVPSVRGSHLEMQSRSIDSYVHAIHSFQLFDIGDINISDPVEAAEHDHKLSAEFPRFGIKDCQSCHLPGKYGVPSQAHSLPSLHAGSDEPDPEEGGIDRNIGGVPEYVMGPAARACGACHRAQMLRADDVDKLTAFNDHVRTFGYLVENDDGVWEAVVEKIMTIFE